MKKCFLLFLLLSAITYTGCKEEDDDTAASVVACGSYTAPHAKIYVHDTVSFHNCSQNATSYSWDFGDNSTSSDSDPTHSYNKSGEFTVIMTSYGEGSSASNPGELGKDYDTIMLKFDVYRLVK